VVANYPLTTVELKRARHSLRGEQLEFIDTPGLHCLYMHSEEELEVRDFLFDEPPDVVIQCIDSNRIRQSLMLTLDLIELGLPLIISLNAIDETQRTGLVVRSAELAAALGVPVVESVATEGRGTEELRRAFLVAPPVRRGARGGDRAGGAAPAP
jgi:ferrous iron transport protein B